ncbi:hypothetical protein BDV27DRAFT_146975 [Aspergillus caelatus]|uniref:Uncharacterized protein n=2 Tax=Aspergillus subgen. Circumdati TaxID=2720871 RepID=A0A5N7A1N0_9EURO|nr:uncharacterized protein BDV27DRAFT_146975 [Aspergillus caelatus]KAE8362410.1 hypothetical protein BDV27DRAFT_146975 [Aspergillus caelatus]KAE8413066.1 hypothetical protein BDV36DRAFT_287361 [Aspergillus pseudocaelatus]
MVTGSSRCDQLDWRRTYGDHEGGRALATITLTTVQRAPIGHLRGWARLTTGHTNDRPGGTVWNFRRFPDAPQQLPTLVANDGADLRNPIFLGN